MPPWRKSPSRMLLRRPTRLIEILRPDRHAYDGCPAYKRFSIMPLAVKRFSITASVFRCASGISLRSEEHTSELQSLMRISYAVFCLQKKIHIYIYNTHYYTTVT